MHLNNTNEKQLYAVSIIIPVYNAESTIKTCVKSILGQTLKQIEIICVDDGSTDNSFDTLKELKKTYNQITILHQENKGAGTARNKAIELAQGEFLAFMDSDDWYPENNILELLYNKAKENNVYIAGGSFSCQKNGVVHKNYNGVFKLYTFQKEEVISYTNYQFDYGFTRFIYNAKILNEHNIRFSEIRFFEDPPFL